MRLTAVESAMISDRQASAAKRSEPSGFENLIAAAAQAQKPAEPQASAQAQTSEAVEPEAKAEKGDKIEKNEKVEKPEKRKKKDDTERADTVTQQSVGIVQEKDAKPPADDGASDIAKSDAPHAVPWCGNDRPTHPQGGIVQKAKAEPVQTPTGDAAAATKPASDETLPVESAGTIDASQIPAEPTEKSAAKPQPELEVAAAPVKAQRNEVKRVVVAKPEQAIERPTVSAATVKAGATQRTQGQADPQSDAGGQQGGSPRQDEPQIKIKKDDLSETPITTSASHDDKQAVAATAAVEVVPAVSIDASIAAAVPSGGEPTPVDPSSRPAAVHAASGGGTTAKDEARPANENDPARVAEQAARALRSVVNQKGGSVVLRLTPPQLGELRVRVEMEGGVVSAKFEVANDQVRSLLQEHMGSLRTALEGQGLSVQQLQVQTTPSAQPSEQQQNSASDDGRSRGQYQQPGGSGGERENTKEQRRQAFEQALNLVA
jgi:flagellar hook-length control protein FliK